MTCPHCHDTGVIEQEDTHDTDYFPCRCQEETMSEQTTLRANRALRRLHHEKWVPREGERWATVTSATHTQIVDALVAAEDVLDDLSGDEIEDITGAILGAALPPR